MYVWKKVKNTGRIKNDCKVLNLHGKNSNTAEENERRGGTG